MIIELGMIIYQSIKNTNGKSCTITTFVSFNAVLFITWMFHERLGKVEDLPVIL